MIEPSAAVAATGVDVIFPVLHGPYGEDGTVQGLLELANVPYVGAGVLGSAVGMDKAVMKILFAAAGLPDWAVPRGAATRMGRRPARRITARIAGDLRYPVFVKPANLGSSVGISKARSEIGVRGSHGAGVAVRPQDRGRSRRFLRRVRLSVLCWATTFPRLRSRARSFHRNEFYDYEAKYLGGGSKQMIPAPLTGAQVREVQKLAIRAFRALDGAGMARVDFLMPRGS